MYMAVIYGYTSVYAFSKNKETAKNLAVSKKKEFCKDELTKWNWDACNEYYGAEVMTIKEGMIHTY